MAGNSAETLERAVGLDRLAIANGHLRGHAVAAGVGAGPGKQLVEDCRNDSAVRDALPAGEVFGQHVVQLDSVRRLPDFELQALRVVFAAGEAAAGVLQHRTNAQ